MPPNQLGYCAIFIYMSTCGLSCSTYLLITMTFERLCCIIWPLQAATLFTVKKARITIVCLFAFWFSYCIPFLFIGDYKGRSCVPNRYASVFLGKLYYWLTQIFIFIFSFTALLTMNSVIIHTLRKRSQLNLSEPTGQGQREGQNDKMKQTEKQIFTMLLLVTFMYLILSFPLRAYSLLSKLLHRKDPIILCWSSFTYSSWSPNILHQLCHKFPVVCYIWKKFRTDLRNVFIRRKSNKNGIPLTTSNNVSSSNGD